MEATRVTVDEVKERMDRGEKFTFVDTRNPKAWGEATTKLPNAIRVPAEEAQERIDEIPQCCVIGSYGSGIVGIVAGVTQTHVDDMCHRLRVTGNGEWLHRIFNGHNDG